MRGNVFLCDNYSVANRLHCCEPYTLCNTLVSLFFFFFFLATHFLGRVTQSSSLCAPLVWVSFKTKARHGKQVCTPPSGSVLCDICFALFVFGSSFQAAVAAVLSAAALLVASCARRETHLSLAETQQESSEAGTDGHARYL